MFAKLNNMGGETIQIRKNLNFSIKSRFENIIYSKIVVSQINT